MFPVHSFQFIHSRACHSDIISGVAFVLSHRSWYVWGSGESMENALRACCKGIKIGKILIHREGDNGKQVLFF